MDWDFSSRWSVTVSKISTGTFHSLRPTSAGPSVLILAGGPLDNMRASFWRPLFGRLLMANDSPSSPGLAFSRRISYWTVTAFVSMVTSGKKLRSIDSYALRIPPSWWRLILADEVLILICGCRTTIDKLWPRCFGSEITVHYQYSQALKRLYMVPLSRFVWRNADQHYFELLNWEPWSQAVCCFKILWSGVSCTMVFPQPRITNDCAKVIRNIISICDNKICMCFWTWNFN